MLCVTCPKVFKSCPLPYFLKKKRKKQKEKKPVHGRGRLHIEREITIAKIAQEMGEGEKAKSQVHNFKSTSWYHIEVFPVVTSK